MLQKKIDPISTTLYQLFKAVPVHITRSTIEERLLQHPSYPSLFAITNTLTHFGVTNKAVQLRPEQLSQVETPLLAVTKNKETVLVRDMDANNIRYFSPSLGWRKTTVDTFLNLWDGMVILVDTEVAIAEDNFKRKQNFEYLLLVKRPLAITLLLSLVFCTAIALGPGMLLWGFVIKLLGVTVALLLVGKEVGTNVNYGFCSNGKKISCNDVLDSPAAKIFSWLSMTDLGILYFIGTLSALLISVIAGDATTTTLYVLLAGANFLAIPYTLFSVYYQAFVVRKWCSLCLGIIGLLWLEATLGIYHGTGLSALPALQLKGFLVFSACLLVPAVIWMFLKPILVKASLYNNIRNAHLRISNNLDIFYLHLKQQKNVPMDYINTEVMLGNPSAKHTLVVAINPYCPACGREYDQILRLLEKHPDFAQVVLRFVGGSQVHTNLQLLTTKLLIELYLDAPGQFPTVLKEWFYTADLKAFVKKHPMRHSSESGTIVQHHINWSHKIHIKITPTTFFNSKKLDEVYTIKQLIRMLDMHPAL